MFVALSQHEDLFCFSKDNSTNFLTFFAFVLSKCEDLYSCDQFYEIEVEKGAELLINTSSSRPKPF